MSFSYAFTYDYITFLFTNKHSHFLIGVVRFLTKIKRFDICRFLFFKSNFLTGFCKEQLYPVQVKYFIYYYFIDILLLSDLINFPSRFEILKKYDSIFYHILLRIEPQMLLKIFHRLMEATFYHNVTIFARSYIIYFQNTHYIFFFCQYRHNFC